MIPRLFSLLRSYLTLVAAAVQSLFLEDAATGRIAILQGIVPMEIELAWTELCELFKQKLKT